MILIAPDKFKRTLTAIQAADIIADTMRLSYNSQLDIIKAPMADGGEGTASILCSGFQWEKHDCYYVNRKTKTAVIDSSAVIGLQNINPLHHDILKASSVPLGIKVREIIKGGCNRVIIGIGGTATCDGGTGFIEALGVEKLKTYRNIIIGLSDVRVPLIAKEGEPSAMMFVRQKGAKNIDIPVIRRRLEALYDKYPKSRSPYDGAGGGLGFAIASVIGAKCYDGAKYVIDSYNIDWSQIDLIVTGEGSIDSQSSHGKVVGTLCDIAERLRIPIVAFGGRVEPGLENERIISTSHYYKDLPLNEKTAALRLQAAVSDWIKHQVD